MALARTGTGGKLPPDANRILFVKNLNYKTRGDDLYDLFGKYGAVRQIRLGNEAKTSMFPPFSLVSEGWRRCPMRRGMQGTLTPSHHPQTGGTAYVVFEEIMDAKSAFDHLNGFHLQERYLVVLYHQAAKLTKAQDIAQREAELKAQKEKFGIKDDD
ncbi:hypothetical protein T439DRAFT_99512 [Meredithblackwellia eburnea MCA 4105]